MLRCPPGGNDVSLLSGVQRRRVALCALLLRQPDLLLLDEPTNHLDAESVQWVEPHLDSYPGTIVAVIHDRYFPDSVAQWILEIDGGRAYPYQGKYATYPESKAERFTVEGRKAPNGKGCCTKNGSGVTTLVTGQNGPFGVAVDSSHLYWTNQGDGTVDDAHLDGSGVTTLVTGQNGPAGVTVTPQ
jgi:hypothetical protein